MAHRESRAGKWNDWRGFFCARPRHVVPVAFAVAGTTSESSRRRNAPRGTWRNVERFHYFPGDAGMRVLLDFGTTGDDPIDATFNVLPRVGEVVNLIGDLYRVVGVEHRIALRATAADIVLHVVAIGKRAWR